MIRVVQKLSGLEAKDAPQAGLSFVFFFCILASYYIVQPLRDELGLLVGEEWTQDLFIWSLVVMMLANPLFSILLNNTGRVKLMKIVYRFFALNIVAFIAIFKYLEGAGQMPSHGEAIKVEGFAFAMGFAYFLWVGIFNLISVSVFWALMADIYSGKQGKLAFGFVGAGGTLGQMFGSLLTSTLVSHLGPTNMLFFSALLLEVAVQAMIRITRNYQEPVREVGEKAPNAFSGFSDIVRSPFLLGICLYLFLYTFTASFIYFQKQNIVALNVEGRADRVGFFSNVNLVISIGTFLIQLFLTGGFLSKIGLSAGLALVPLVSIFGFLALAKRPDLLTIALIDIVRKTSNYAISRPAREVLFTAVSRREKYLAKNFIDTVVYRAGDGMAAFIFRTFFSTAGAAAIVSLSALGVSVIYLVVAVFLGKAHANKMVDLAKADAARELQQEKDPQGP